MRPTSGTLERIGSLAPGVARSAAAALALMFGAIPAWAATAPPDAPQQEAVPLERMELATPPAGVALVPPPASDPLRMPFFHDATFGLQLRTFYFDREKYDASHSEAWAIGGSLSFLSGWANNFFRLGAVAYTSQPLHAPDDRDGTLLLKTGQEGYTVLGQIYGEFKFADGVFGAIGRKTYDTPYVNRNDNRMTPNTFEGVTVYGSSGGKDGAPAWRYGGGYLSKIKERNSDEFVWMSRDAGASVDRGVYLAGANYKLNDFSIGAIDYYADDIINIFYTEASYAFPLSKDVSLKLSAQYADQRSTGSDLLTGADFSTRQWGVKGDIGVGAAAFTLAYTDTANGDTMRSPWGGYPGYTSVQVQDFFRAGESASMVKAAYDFTRHGAPGLSAYALWVHGAGVKAPAYNEDEYDLNVQWTPDKTGFRRGLSVRLRYAQVDQRGGGDPSIKDFRVIVNYDFPRP
jgi:hypothetical protein